MDHDHSEDALLPSTDDPDLLNAILTEGDDGRIVMISRALPELERHARALGGTPFPCETWVFPPEHRAAVRELYLALFTDRPANQEPFFPVRIESDDGVPQIRRLAPFQIATMVAAGAKVELLARHDEYRQWLEDEYAKCMAAFECLDAVYAQVVGT